MEEVYPVAKEVSSISWLKWGVGTSLRGASRRSSTSLPLSVSLKTALMQARALYNYETEEEDELTLRAGERLFILGLSQPEWLVAARSGGASNAQAEIGLVPANYVSLEAHKTDPATPGV